MTEEMSAYMTDEHEHEPEPEATQCPCCFGPAYLLPAAGYIIDCPVCGKLSQKVIERLVYINNPDKGKFELIGEEQSKSVAQLVLEKRNEGKVVVMGWEGLMSCSIKDIIEQPADGLLYDLNRGEEVTLTFINDRKWVNDFAVALVIRALYDKILSLNVMLDACKNDAKDKDNDKCKDSKEEL